MSAHSQKLNLAHPGLHNYLSNAQSFSGESIPPALTAMLLPAVPCQCLIVPAVRAPPPTPHSRSDAPSSQLQVEVELLPSSAPPLLPAPFPSQSQPSPRHQAPPHDPASASGVRTTVHHSPHRRPGRTDDSLTNKRTTAQSQLSTDNITDRRTIGLPRLLRWLYCKHKLLN